MAINHIVTFDGADSKARKIIFTFRVHVGHFCRFAADQRCASLMAALRDARDHTRSDVDFESPAGEIIEKKQWFRTLHEHVIDTHGDQIDSYRVVHVEMLGKHEFCADAIGAGYEHWLPVAAGRKGEKPAESSESCENFGPVRTLDERPDPFDEIVAGIDIDASILIGQGLHRRYNSAWASMGKPSLLKSRLAMLALAFVTWPAWAVEVASLYTAQVPLDQEEDDPRARAYEMALADVLLRVSGTELGSDPDRIELLFPDPAAYVVQFRPDAEDTLWVSFDGEAVERVLRRAGETVWGADRPLTLVWLAVDWGQGEREIIAADDPVRSRDEARSIDRNRLLRQRVLDIAERRGLPVAFPLLDSVDLQNLSFSDIWGGFDDPLLVASERYEADSILVGRVRPASTQRNRWSFYFGGEERAWSGEPELVVNAVADLLAAEFAISGTAVIESIDLVIAGIESVESFGAVQKLLSGMTVVEKFSIVEVAGDRIRFRLDAIGGEERLRRALRFSGLFEQNGPEDDQDVPDYYDRPLEFFYNP